MIKKSILRLVLGIIVSVLIMALSFFFFLFINPLGIHESNSLKWIPILIGVLSLFVSGTINSTTPVKFLGLLFLPYAIFHLFNFTYFPFILILILTGLLTLVVTRKNQLKKYKMYGWAGIIAVFGFYLLAQPLIITKEGFGYDDTGELINANVLWDFTDEEELVVPSHILYDKSNTEYDMANIKGKTHLVTFWATWCAPCIQEKPAMDQLKKELQNNGEIGFIDVSFDDSESDRWTQFLEKNKPLGLQLISASQKKTSRALNFTGIPMHFIVNSDGSYKEYRSFEVAQKVLKKSLMH